MNDPVTLSTTSITSSGVSIGNISATKARTVPDVNDQENTQKGKETSTAEIEKESEKVKKAATKRKLCATTYSQET